MEESSVDDSTKVDISEDILEDGISDPKEIANPEVVEEEIPESTFEDGVYTVNSVLSAKPFPIEAETIPTEEKCNITVPSEVNSIQEAINKSSAENPLTICIKPGEYKENLIIKEKPVSLVGLKGGVVIMGANAEEPTIRILNTKNVTIDGFTFQDANGAYGAIHIASAENCTIRNNVFLKNSLDIFTDGGSQHTITNNKFNGRNLAIKGNSTGSSLMDNTFSNYSTAIAIGEEHKIFKNGFVNNTIQIETGTMTGIIENYLSQNAFDRAVVVRENPITVGKIFSRIQDAVDAAEDGNTIQVLSGTYEEVVNINKSLSLVGVEEKAPTIYGGFVINIDTSGKVIIENINFEVPVGNPVDSISANGVNELELYVTKSHFNGSNLFASGKIGIMSNNVQSRVIVESSNFTNGYYTAIQGKYKELNIKNTTISNCKSGINFQGGSYLFVSNTDISVVAQGASNDTYAVRFASNNANTGKDMILNGGTYSVDRGDFTADDETYHSAIIVRSGASGTLKANSLSLDGEVVNLSEKQLDATNNWWGDASGPKDMIPNDGSILNQNLNGKGSSAIGAVKYAPWYKGTDMTNLTSANAITQDATNLSLYDAMLNGTNGDYDATGHSFWVSLSPFSTDSPNIPSNVYSTQDFGVIKANTDFSVSLSSITDSGIPEDLPSIIPNATYYFVAWSLVDGTWYPGEVKSFTTLPINAPTNGAPNGTYITTNEFDFTWDASTDVSSITYEFQSSLNPSQVDGVLTTDLFKSETLTSNMIHSSGASDGIWYWQVRAKDAAGNYSDWSEIWTVTIDTTPPTIPQNLRFENPSLQCGDITNNYNITPTWNESEDMLSGLYRYEYFVNTPGVQGWTIYRHTNNYPAVFNQGEGKYTFKVRAIDNVNNISDWSNECTITYDKTPAEITITPSRSPDIGQWYSTRPTYSNTFPTFEISTNEESQIEYKWNDGTWNTYTETEAIKYEENGKHILYVKATDLAGNTTDEKQLDVWLDFSNPEGIFTIDDGDNLVRGTLQLNFTNVIDPSGSEEIDRIEIWVDGYGYKGSATKVEEGVYKFDLETTQFDNGNYTIRPSIFDMAGNRTRPSINITIDNTPPEFSLSGIKYTYMKNGEEQTTVQSRSATNLNKPVFVGNLISTDIASVKVVIKGTEYTATINNDMTWETTIDNPLVDGSYKVKIIATDFAGNTTTIEKYLFIDTVAPTATFKHYKDGVEINEIINPITYVKGINQLSFTAEYSDEIPSSGLFQDSYVIFEAQNDGSFKFSQNGKKAFCSWRKEPNLVTGLSGATYSLTDKEEFTNCIETLPDGEYYMAHQVYDRATRKDIPSIYQFRDVLGLHFKVDNTPPVITGLSDMTLIEGAAFPTTGTVNLTETNLDKVYISISDSSDTHTKEFTATSTFILEDSLRQTIEEWKGNSFTTIDLNVLPEGTYNISYYATDKAGNVSTTQTFVVTIQNNPPVVTITPSLTEVTAGTPVVLSASVTGGNESFTYAWSGACSSSEATTTFNTDTPGTYTCTLTVTDADGDTATDNIEITVGAVPSESIEENGDDTTGDTLGIRDSSIPTTPEEVLGAIFTPKPVQASTQSLLGTGGYLYTQTTNEEQDTEEEETTKEEIVTQEEDAEVKGEEDNREENSEEETTEEEGTKWWVYPLVILPVLAIFLILWKRRKEEDEPQF